MRLQLASREATSCKTVKRFLTAETCPRDEKNHSISRVVGTNNETKDNNNERVVSLERERDLHSLWQGER